LCQRQQNFPGGRKFYDLINQWLDNTTAKLYASCQGQIKAAIAPMMPPILITEMTGVGGYSPQAIKWHDAKEVELQGNVHMKAAIGTAIR